MSGVKWDKARVIAELRRLEEGGEVPTGARLFTMNGPLFRAARTHFGTYAKAVKAAGLRVRVRQPARVWTAERVLGALRRKHLEPCDGSYRSQRDDGALTQAAIRHFGSYRKALQAAGVDPSEVRPPAHCPLWNRSTIVEELRRLHQAGQNLGVGALGRTHHGLAAAMAREFGSHEAACRAAGIDYQQVAKQALEARAATRAANAAARTAAAAPGDRAATLQAIARLQQEGADLSYVHASRVNRALLRRASRQFGSWSRAVEAAGIDYAAFRRQQQWTPPRVADQLRRRQSAGEDLSPGHMVTSVGPLYQAALSHFGSYRAALEAAGIDYEQALRPAPKWPADRVLEEIRRLRDLGADLSYNAVKASHHALLAGAQRQFGNYHRAVEAAGIPYEQVAREIQQSWDRDKIVAALRQRHAEGIGLDYTSVRRAGGPLLSAIHRHFKTYREAVEAAGIDYDTVSRSARRRGGSGHWTEESVLRALRDLHAQGHDLRYRPMKARSQPLFFAAKDLFGSYVNAVRVAGIDYWAMSQAQLERERREKAERR